jgi:SAM-dependent methyltransferase
MPAGETPAWRALIADPGHLRQVGPALYTSLPETAGAAQYDRKAALYDAIVGRSLYHRVLWGTWAGAYTRFAQTALDAAGPGPFAEIGCGSLLFTAALYRRADGPSPVLAVDRSIGMLRRAVDRLARRGVDRGGGLAALHADCAAMPLRPGIFPSILCLNLLHVPCDREGIVAECRRLLVQGRGRLFVSTLIRSGRWSDRVVTLFHRAGELGVPMTRERACETVAGSWARIESVHVAGNMAFIVARHAG